MLVSTATAAPSAIDADTIALGAATGAALPAFVPAAIGDLVASGEARTAYKALAVAHADSKRWIIAGLGGPGELGPERLRAIAAAVHARALEISTRALCWALPDPGAASAQASANGDDAAKAAVLAPSELAAALVEGTLLADYRFERFKSERLDSARGSDESPKHLERLVVAAPSEAPGAAPGAAPSEAPSEAPGDTPGGAAIEQAVAQAAVVAEAVNAARDLQNRPGNDLTPTALAEYARELARELGSVSVDIEGRAGIAGRSMGAFAAVAQGSEQEPALITLRYEPPARDPAGAASGGQSASGPGEASARSEPPVLGLVGKAITFDSGGISLKPGAKMSEMKFDMSGGAAVIAAIAAIARLELPLRVLGVVGASENLPSGRSVKPGDIVTASNGTTIEINNTDAEGRLVLADCLHHAVTLGAERIVDLATLTGAVIVALGSTYAGLMSNDDDLARHVTDAGERTGELVWRLPMHDEYQELIRGRYADLDNAPEERKAGTIVAGTFLSNFVDDVPWAHLDIAGSAWDLGRPYAPKGAAGYGVRLLVELARSYCSA